jgi:hypothetical protein
MKFFFEVLFVVSNRSGFMSLPSRVFDESELMFTLKFRPILASHRRWSEIMQRL